jgi:hypothetical protein
MVGAVGWRIGHLCAGIQLYKNPSITRRIQSITLGDKTDGQLEFAE